MADFSAEDRALLDAVRAAPDDDGPRLVAADAWDDRGDPRGRFVRVQLALASLPPFDHRRGPLEAEERKLLARHADEWSAPLAGLASGVVFRRGFIHEINLTARQFLTHAGAVFDAAPIRHLHLLDAGRNLPAVIASPLLARLEGLSVFAQYLGGPGGLASALANAISLSGLRHLSLGRNRLTDDDVVMLTHAPFNETLDSLDLHDNPVGDDGLVRLGESGTFPRLTSLNLSLTSVGPTGAAAIARAPHRPGFESLAVAGNPSFGRSAADGIELFRIPSLDLSGTGLNLLGLNRYVRASPDGGVRTLNVSGNNLGDGGAAVLASATTFADLLELDLRHNEITAEGVERIAESTALGRLGRLDLTMNPIEPLGWAALLTTKGLSSLKRLELPAAGMAKPLRDALEAKYHPRAVGSSRKLES